MYTKHLLVPLFTLAVAVIGFASATAAHANEVSYENPLVQQSTLTRAQVRGEAVRAHNAGEYSVGEQSWVPVLMGIAKTRAQVVAEIHEAIRLGLVSGGEEDVVATSEQNARVELAGLKALSMTVAARR